ncbi:MAG: hypothetical protein AB8H80_19640 [Planctomycetota bacterium]
MLKLYRHNKNKIVAYHEAWIADTVVMEHWGPIGERGEMLEHPFDPDLSDEQALQHVLLKAVKQGYSELAYDDHATLIIEYPVADMGTEADLKLRHDLEARLAETLGWTGLGHCDGGSIGSGTMEVCCMVVDYELARSIIEKDLAGTEFEGFARIYDEADE